MKFYIYDREEHRTLEYDGFSLEEFNHDYLLGICEEMGFAYNEYTEEYTVSSKTYNYLRDVLERRRELESMIEALKEKYGTNMVLDTLMDCPHTTGPYDPIKEIEEEEDCLRRKFSEFFY